MKTAFLLSCLVLLASAISIRDQLSSESEVDLEMHDLSRADRWCYRKQIYRFMKWTCSFDDEEDPHQAMMDAVMEWFETYGKPSEQGTEGNILCKEAFC